MSDRVVVDPDGRASPDQASAVSIPAATGTTPGSARVCGVSDLSYDRNCYLTKLGCIPDSQLANSSIYFVIMENGRPKQERPFNKIVNGYGDPSNPKNIHAPVAPGAVVELWGFNIDTANAWTVSGTIECTEETRR